MNLVSYLSVVRGDLPGQETVASAVETEVAGVADSAEVLVHECWMTHGDRGIEGVLLVDYDSSKRFDYLAVEGQEAELLDSIRVRVGDGWQPIGLSLIRREFKPHESLVAVLRRPVGT